jgi:hypothetical protein
MVTLNDVLISAQALPSSDRARLIASLWDTTSPEDWVPPNADWVGEANRRSNAFDVGEETASDWLAARKRARKAAGLED